MHVRANTPWDGRQPTVVGPAGGALRCHPTFSFAGALDEVPADDATTLSEVTRLLLRHGDMHGGRPARVQVMTDAATLNLWLDDPECSTGCINHAGELSAIDAACRSHGARMSLRDANGLHLHWFLPIADRMRTVR